MAQARPTKWFYKMGARARFSVVVHARRLKGNQRLTKELVKYSPIL